LDSCRLNEAVGGESDRKIGVVFLKELQIPPGALITSENMG